MGTESIMSPDRLKFFTSIRAHNWPYAYKAIACMKMQELLWSFASVRRSDLEAFWCNKDLIANEKDWDVARLEYAMDVVRHRKLPNSKLKLKADELKDVLNYIKGDKANQLILTEDPTGFLPLPNLNAARLAISDYETAARELGVETAAVRAVAEVECKGVGFDRHGRPRILFEGHYFRRLTGGKYSASHPHLSHAATKKFYSWDQWSLMYEAMTLDYEAALESASWGVFQIMGEYHQSLCGKTLKDYITLMFTSEYEHLRLFMAYSRGKNIVRHLLSHNWKLFAEGFNGKNQVGYDTLMATAYRKYAKPQTLAKAVK
jgi:N-acetylmuramidase-like protein